MAYRRQRGMDEPPLIEGAIFGAVSFVVGYIITALLVVLAEDVEEDLMQVSGWVYYNAQFVDVAGDGGSGSFNFVTDEILGQALLELPSIIYHLVPVVVLIGAGFLLAQQASAIEAKNGAIAGATLVLGCVVLALLGTVLFETNSTSPKLIPGILVVGILYPAIFGAIGGVLNTQL